MKIFFCFRMILVEEFNRILNLSQKTFAELLDSRRSDIVGF
jgi:plasmid maintenance system antidote protein VapI